MKITKDTKIYAGTNKVVKVYKGNNVIYEYNSSPYTELSYIQSTGTQYIDANLPNNTRGFKVKLKYEFTDNRNNQFLYGAEGPSPYNRNYYKRNNSTTMEVGAYMYNAITCPSSVGTVYEAIVRTQKSIEQSLRVDGQLKWSSASYLSYDRTSLTPYIFALNGRGSPMENSYMKLYYIQFYDAYENMLRDFIPVLDKNNVPCLYDKLSGTFFYNLGTGTFLYG